MTEFNQLQDQLNVEEQDLKSLPQTLNVLTILTYIGSAMQLLGALFTYFTIEMSYRMYENVSRDGMPADNPFSKFMRAANETMKKQYENRTLIMVTAVLCAVICFYGALQMRSRKKAGFGIYVAGEFIYPVVNMILIGLGGLGILGIIGFIVPIVFVILYSLQRKHLIH